MNESAMESLLRRLQEVADLQGATALLGWDQATYMPPGGAEVRGRQIGTLAQLAHQAFVDPAVGSLLDELERSATDLDPDSDEARLISVTRFDYERATRVPAVFLAELEQHSSRGFQLWAEARPADDFQKVADHLERTVELSRRYSSFFDGYEHIADALIDESDRGMTVERIRPLFAELRKRLVPLVDATIAAQKDSGPDAGEASTGGGRGSAPSPLLGRFPVADQIAFGEAIIAEFGFDFRRGRQDRSDHPFATTIGRNDVRITTRLKETDLSEGLFSTLHESGHAMYEQGVDQALFGTPLATGTSSGVHESQSRLWENVVGRSWEFWQHYYPRLQGTFRSELGTVSLDQFYRAINHVARSLIRTDADELTYNLHVMIRFDLECELLEGSLKVTELPEAWRARYRSDLGIESHGDRDGVLQDVHWYSGLIGGAFQGYTIGNILSMQFYRAALQAEPSITQEVAAGRFETLHTWLTQNIWRHGRKFTPDELIERATGSELTVEPYLEYLERKYGGLQGRR